MIIAQEKKKENIVEYLLYMWHIEDLIRAYNFNLENIEKEIIAKFDIDDQTYKKMLDWYDNLIQLMINEKVEEKGHIQAIQNIIDELARTHIFLLEAPIELDYRKKFEELLPFTEDLIAKAQNKNISLIQIFLEALYGVLLLKMKRETISPQTQEAVEKISNFLSILAQKYYEYENKNN